MQAVAERVKAGAWAEAHVGPLRGMVGRAELKGRRWAAREWARGRKRSWARRKGWVGPGREKKEKGLGWARLLGFGLGSLFLSHSISFLFSISKLFYS